MDFTASQWADIIPIPQNDGPEPLVPIAYAPEYAAAMDYFRAVFAAGEYSARVLELTSFIINENPSHYAVWKYRLDTVMALKTPLNSELSFTEELAAEHPKSYQIWHHRQAIADQDNEPEREIAFINRMLEIDSKNYHAWSYRQHVVSKHKLWKSELVDIDRLLQEDVRNNSAWNQRFFVYSRSVDTLNSEDLEHEVQYTLARINMAVQNESPWNYLRGMIQQLAGKKLCDVESAEVASLRLSGAPHHCTHAMSYLADIYQERGQQKEFITMCTTLVQADAIRRLYWLSRIDGISAAEQ
ncbi:hypothetical protein BASA50_000823 [Batrachochytrium salamandrivorans]|uniref:Protein farnesyltransferase/geranylgeranyltransferase type-1 subunit alpha n=1 Tax=Batrachochytrium salamandrivorans TaxID=1357716 RepID=A0ABQ8ESF8_9FUNG|nr:hypothetical protein BASA62_010173 [Batrachochytrium salamandrivorans]KAH6579689.1 hypothetical protein BASA60_003188 [Batrachochytrium salamandrivorans]KAH6585878.1 hypothetical protein BASA50_000823 [Batrachochytrium salamandrivorans]KAH9254496.1 hypothetical protein BASA81_007609 [Batrachochytrium salamandrivorans]KAH9275841.1 hypothetical protein BASA83_001645 [Batrachochytrium salamandrivorans]